MWKRCPAQKAAYEQKATSSEAEILPVLRYRVNWEEASINTFVYHGGNPARCVTQPHSSALLKGRAHPLLLPDPHLVLPLAFSKLLVQFQNSRK